MVGKRDNAPKKLESKATSAFSKSNVKSKKNESTSKTLAKSETKPVHSSNVKRKERYLEGEKKNL